MDAENAYWQSYSITTPACEGVPYPFPPTTLNPRHVIKLSIVLDCEARYDFSAIRLVVFCDPLYVFDNLVIMGYDNVCQFSSARDLARRRRNISQLTAQSDRPQFKVCIVAFNISQQGVSHQFSIVHTTENQFNLDPDVISFRRVVYDCTYSTSSYNSSALVFLRFDRLNVLTWHSLRDPYYDHPMHSIRILPMPSRRRGSCATLPPSIIRRIVSLAIEGVRQLLTYALVCKAWEHVLELFFENFGNNHVKTARWYPNQILRTLRWKPQYGTLIRRLSYDDFHIDSWGGPSIDFWEDFFEIMGYATSLSYFHLPILPRDLLDEYMDALCNLPNISESFFGVYSSGSTRDRHAMSMAYIQIVIMKWKLKKLSIVGWGKAREHNSKRALPGDLQCSIQQLQLHHGYLTADQLLYFSSATRCNLNRIDFCNITGPSNSNFRQFLSVAAPTLTNIVVKSCNFPTHIGEELALDATMPEMTALQELWVTDNVISIVGLARKPYNAPELSSTITIQCDYSSMEIEDFEKAICLTRWGAIRVYNTPWDWCPSIVARIEETARNRGIDILMVDYSPVF